jgi:hypothetical protein
MALQLNNYNTDFGTVEPAAYLTITGFGGNAKIVSLSISIYASLAAFSAMAAPLANIRKQMPFVDGMSLSMAYAYLLTLPEFAGATLV